MQIGFHPFCTDPLLQTVGEIDDGCDNRRIGSSADLKRDVRPPPVPHKY
jgi:hypothetical protein